MPPGTQNWRLKGLDFLTMLAPGAGPAKLCILEEQEETADRKDRGQEADGKKGSPINQKPIWETRTRSMQAQLRLTKQVDWLRNAYLPLASECIPLPPKNAIIWKTSHAYNFIISRSSLANTLHLKMKKKIKSNFWKIFIVANYTMKEYSEFPKIYLKKNDKLQNWPLFSLNSTTLYITL